MKKPKVIMHSSISLDGSLLGFAVDMETHYRIAGRYKPDMHLIGSKTAIAGIRLFHPRLPKEEAGDYRKPERDAGLPLWVIPDTKGTLQGMLHVLRRFELCKDILILTSHTTPKRYHTYLKERNYACRVIGKKRVDYAEAINSLARDYKAKIILTDTGRELNCILLNQGLIDEISLLMHPVIVGEKKRYTLLDDVSASRHLRLVKTQAIGKDSVWLVYKVIKE